MKQALALAAMALFALNACAEAPDEAPKTTSQADEFAARINGGKVAQAEPIAPSGPTPSPLPSPSVAQPLDGITNTPYSAGTASDPNSACNANIFGEYLGRKPSAQVRAAILETARDQGEVRFIAAGGEYIKPDPTNPRLNIMIAVDGVIRDIRCG
ncbi:MAG: hypothetical protein AAF251_03195 [Pseudomonadota bacterium]